MISSIITDKTATVYLDLEAYTVDRSTIAFERITELLAADEPDEEAIREVFRTHNLKEEQFAAPALRGRVEVRNRGVYYDGVLINNALTSRILDIVQAKLPVAPWVKFMERLYANPAGWAQDELYLWLETSDLPITEDGYFLAYKKIKGDYTDIYTGRISNAVGSVVEMPGGRRVVDPNRNNTCSVGLHFCSKNYLPHFGASNGNRVVILKIDPADVVSIPSDYDNAKGRCWRYEVIGELVDETPAEKVWEPVVQSNGDAFRFDPEGYDHNGYDVDGYDRDGYDSEGYDEDGYDHNGYDRAGNDFDGVPDLDDGEIEEEAVASTSSQAPARDYRSEYARRTAAAKKAGFSSYGAQRRAAGY